MTWSFLSRLLITLSQTAYFWLFPDSPKCYQFPALGQELCVFIRQDIPDIPPQCGRVGQHTLGDKDCTVRGYGLYNDRIKTVE